jgi:glycerophosphoryl diester phosphodiesterase
MQHKPCLIRRELWMRVSLTAFVLGGALLAVDWFGLSKAHAESEPDSDWMANSAVMDSKIISDTTIGEAQGGVYKNGRVYVMSDMSFKDPRVGVIVEYDYDKGTLLPTGRRIQLTRNSESLLMHPTGLTFHPKLGAFLGNTVAGKSTIFKLDWDTALREKNLDHAVLKEINDDAARNGGRPEFVTVKENGVERTLLATADYNTQTPEIRLYDAQRMEQIGHTDSPDVLVRRIKASPYNQSLLWDAGKHTLTCIQNVTLGRGWQFDVIDLDIAMKAGDVESPGARISKKVFPPHDELEGVVALPDAMLFMTSSYNDNYVIGKPTSIVPRITEKGFMNVIFSNEKERNPEQSVGKILSEKAGVPYPTVIGHRGAPYYAPEETFPSYILGRDLGADYLEADLQRTKDGVIICLHDTNLKRTTNIEQVFPERANDPINSFTLAELKQLDAGSWFNKKHPERARTSYVGLKIVTLDELIDIALGGKNKPGIYIETKVATMFPGIEEDIYKQLKRRGLLEPPPEKPEGFDASKNVGVGYTKGRVVLQTFEKTSLPLLNKYMPDVPKVFLLWLDDGAMASTTPNVKPEPNQNMAEFYSKLEVTKEEFAKWIDFAVENGAVGTGPSSTLTALGEESYMDLVKPWMNELTHKKGLFIHAYTVDDEVDMNKIIQSGVDGLFTNRADVLLKYYGRTPQDSVDEILKKYKY